ncbi:hypothetical protein C0J08_01175 [Marinomonas sp. CT5]|uniref:zf-HC2 domain-containing protein n=1 Tax=Marinomonas sp. CT5 TaxID=2066133 RepID=UPI0017AD7014|nr:zf-HC2 domain-containing protein [Marinomonas sp. CT5]NVK72369.1 zf-HC2 domain-containing protein [Oceanospirillaceae bacterium]QUX94096.1 hypothetical protein C0J08_01175 [Marinomonas sp. CT5]
MIKCKQATQMLSEKLDRPLTTKEKMALTMHTTMCGACRQFGKQMEEMRKISKTYTKERNTNEK